MKFEIDLENIEFSFDNIAKKLLLSNVISINNNDLEITEIEFYFFKKGIHEDKYTHEHLFEAGRWRFHNQGIDITFQGNQTQDGGILIRGIKEGNNYINGPIKSLAHIFKLMGNVNTENTIRLNHKELARVSIIKTHRHLPNKISYEDFHEKKYRYLKEFDNLAIETKLKQTISKNFIEI